MADVYSRKVYWVRCFLRVTLAVDTCCSSWNQNWVHSAECSRQRLFVKDGPLVHLMLNCEKCYELKRRWLGLETNLCVCIGVAFSSNLDWVTHCKGKGKGFPVQAIKACRGNRGIDPHVINFVSRWSWVVRFRNRRFTHRKIPALPTD
jgi:hypothetical protein